MYIYICTYIYIYNDLALERGLKYNHSICVKKG